MDPLRAGPFYHLTSLKTIILITTIINNIMMIRKIKNKQKKIKIKKIMMKYSTMISKDGKNMLMANNKIM